MSRRRSKLIMRLRDRKGRRREGLVLVEGRRAVREALAAGAEPRFALVSPRLGAGEGGVELERVLVRRTEVEPVSDEELAAAADTGRPQGVLLVCGEPSPPAPVWGRGRHLVLDAVQDPGNAGALIRSAVAFGLDGVAVLEGTVDPWGPKTVRASAGMVFRLPPVRMTAAAFLEAASAEGAAVLVAAMAGEDVRTVAPPPSWALVVGNEGHGVRPELASAGRGVRVAMPGPAESLNAAAAGAVLLHQLTQGVSSG